MTVRFISPLPPFIFVLDVLSQLVSAEVEKCLVEGLKVGLDNLHLICLQLTDDTLFICSVDNSFRNLYGFF